MGYALTSWEKGGRAVIGLDMGGKFSLFLRGAVRSSNYILRCLGTSTDVSRFDGTYEVRGHTGAT